MMRGAQDGSPAARACSRNNEPARCQPVLEWRLPIAVPAAAGGSAATQYDEQLAYSGREQAARACLHSCETDRPGRSSSGMLGFPVTGGGVACWAVLLPVSRRAGSCMCKPVMLIGYAVVVLHGSQVVLYVTQRRGLKEFSVHL